MGFYQGDGMSSSKMLAAVVPSLNGKWEDKEVSTPQHGTNQVHWATFNRKLLKLILVCI